MRFREFSAVYNSKTIGVSLLTFLLRKNFKLIKDSVAKRKKK